MTTKTNWISLLAEAVVANAMSSEKTGHLGSYLNHIESVEFAGLDEDGCWEFQVTQWFELSGQPTVVRKVSLRELCDIVGRAIGDGIMDHICNTEWHTKNPGVLP